MEIRITAEGCVDERYLPRLRGLRTQEWLVHAAGVEKTKRLVPLLHMELGHLLACPITGTIYNPRTGRTSDRDLWLVKPLEAAAEPIEVDL